MKARRRFSPKMALKPVWQLQDQRRAECGSRPVQNGCDRQVILRLVDAVEKKLGCQAILIIQTVDLHCQHGMQVISDAGGILACGRDSSSMEPELELEQGAVKRAATRADR
jgi:hypothetical protein